MNCPHCAAAVAGEPPTCPACAQRLEVAALEVLETSQLYRLWPRTYTVGRGPGNDVGLLDTTVSRQHARLVWEQGRFVVEDLESRQGLFVDEARVQRAPLTAGSRIRLGEINIRFLPPLPQVTEAPAGSPPTETTLRPQKLLLSMVEALNSTLVLSEVLRKVLDAVMDITWAERGYLLLAEDGPEEGPDRVCGLRLRAARDRVGGGTPSSVEGISRSVLRQVLDLGEKVATGDALSDPHLVPSQSISDRMLHTIVCLPLCPPPTPGTPRPAALGVIYVDNQAVSEGFSPDGMAAVGALCRHAALAIDNARRFEREEQQIRALQEARDRAEEAARAKSAFLANMSHELHTPLNAIIGYAEMVLERARELQEADMVKDLERIRTSGGNLLRLLDDILDFTRIQDGKLPLRPEPVNVEEMLEGLVEKARPAAARNHNTLELSVSGALGQALLDSRRVRQALAQLLSNAAKFTRQGSIRLEARRQEAEGTEWLELTVADTGIGMTPEQLSRAFQPFTQADGTLTRRYEGVGLGLSLTRRLCEVMGGSIAVETAPNQGSRFRVRLPTVCPGAEIPA